MYEQIYKVVEMIVEPYQHREKQMSLRQCKKCEMNFNAVGRVNICDICKVTPEQEAAYDRMMAKKQCISNLMFIKLESAKDE